MKKKIVEVVTRKRKPVWATLDPFVTEHVSKIAAASGRTLSATIEELLRLAVSILDEAHVNPNGWTTAWLEKIRSANVRTR